jgi:prolyl 4-hydroxylase
MLRERILYLFSILSFFVRLGRRVRFLSSFCRVYLNTVERSGGTIFRDLKDPDGRPLSVRPREGSALLFFPALENGEPDDRTLHRGEKLDPDEEKWIVQMWIHQRDYRAAVPPNNRQEDALEAIRETCTDRG